MMRLQASLLTEPDLVHPRWELFITNLVKMELPVTISDEAKISQSNYYKTS